MSNNITEITYSCGEEGLVNVSIGSGGVQSIEESFVNGVYSCLVHKESTSVRIFNIVEVIYKDGE